LSGLSNLTYLYINGNAFTCVEGGYPAQLTIQFNWPPICE